MLRLGNVLAGRTRDLAALLLIGGVLLNFVNVVSRYFFSAPIEWGEEVLLFFMVAIVFLGSVHVSWMGKQIAMDVIVAALPPAIRRVIRPLAMLCEIGVALVIVAISVPVILQLWDFDQRSQAADIPLAIPQALIPLGFLLIAIVTLIRLMQFFMRGGVDAVPSMHQDLTSAL